jgi:hypothetical protein
MLLWTWQLLGWMHSKAALLKWVVGLVPYMARSGKVIANVVPASALDVTSMLPP